jgi:hypothetical protein
LGKISENFARRRREEGEAGDEAGFGAFENVVPDAAEGGASAGTDGDDEELILHLDRGMDQDREEAEAEGDEDDFEAEVADGETAFELHAFIVDIASDALGPNDRKIGDRKMQAGNGGKFSHGSTRMKHG